jgi:hypothetical protein
MVSFWIPPACSVWPIRCRALSPGHDCAGTSRPLCVSGSDFSSPSPPSPSFLSASLRCFRVYRLSLLPPPLSQLGSGVSLSAPGLFVGRLAVPLTLARWGACRRTGFSPGRLLGWSRPFPSQCSFAACFVPSPRPCRHIPFLSRSSMLPALL